MTLSTLTNKRWLYTQVPAPDIDNRTITLVDGDIPSEKDMGDGDVLIKTTFFSVDPYMRLCMAPANDGVPVPPFVIGCPLNGAATGEVIFTRNPNFVVGDHVVGHLPWQKIVLAQGGKGLTKIDTARISPSAYLGILGTTGLTASLALEKIAEPKAGETIFISGAAGAVGTVAGQLAKVMGLNVVGCAGSDEKVKHLKTLGFDAAFNYKAVGSLEVALKEACPTGIDIYWDNVGGAILQAALAEMNVFGRIIQCGSISEYNSKSSEKTGTTINLLDMVFKRLKIEGFVVLDHQQQFEETTELLMRLIESGELNPQETVLNGFHQLNNALIDIFNGQNIGKMIVKV